MDPDEVIPLIEEVAPETEPYIEEATAAIDRVAQPINQELIKEEDEAAAGIKSGFEWLKDKAQSCLNRLRGVEDEAQKEANTESSGCPACEKAQGAGESEGKPLDWSRTNPSGETASEHVQLHGADDLSKPIHGVFSDDPISTTEEAWTKAQADGIQPVAQGARDVYTVPMGRAVGWQGGSAGTGSPLTNVFIVIQRSTGQVVTAFPK